MTTRKSQLCSHGDCQIRIIKLMVGPDARGTIIGSAIALPPGFRQWCRSTCPNMKEQK